MDQSPPEFERLATRYQTTSRSVRRWHALGVDVNDPAQVALYLASIQHPAPAAVQAVRSLLKTELSTL